MGAPPIDLFIDPGGSRIGSRFPVRKDLVIANPLAELSILNVGSGSRRMLEISTGNADLYRDFYTFCCTVADKIQIDHQPVERALSETLSSWSALIRHKTLLSDEAQIGLIGELLFLNRAVSAIGWRSASKAWQGNSKNQEEHDFVLSKSDVEIKTTRNECRIHQISSLRQLVPKPCRRLVVVSVQLTPGTGKASFSLTSLVASVLTSAVSASPNIADLVRQQLETQRWRDEDAPHYNAQYHLRSKMAAIPVDNKFPAIVPDTLLALGPERKARINAVRYEVNLDDLGSLDGSKKFDQTLFHR